MGIGTSSSIFGCREKDVELPGPWITGAQQFNEMWKRVLDLQRGWNGIGGRKPTGLWQAKGGGMKGRGKKQRNTNQMKSDK